jgi:hypothetical protein
MHLVQLLLPLYDNSGNAFSETVFSGIRGELTERFGGLPLRQLRRKVYGSAKGERRMMRLW